MTAGRIVSRTFSTPGRSVLCSVSTPPFHMVARLDETIDAQIFYNGVFEPAVTSVIRAVLLPGQTFIDVGANAGYYSLLAWSNLKPGGNVIAFEPDSNSLRRFKANLAFNPGCGITVVPIALSDHDGTSRFWESSPSQSNQGGGTLCAGQGTGKDVQTIRLDSYIEQSDVEAIDLLKMDIEGAEGLALDGMRQCLRDFRIKRLLLEMHRQPLEGSGRSPAAIVQQLQAAGYVGFRVRRVSAIGHRKYRDRGLHRFDRITESDFLADLAHYYFTCPDVVLPESANTRVTNG